jgi:hypothetical protein
VQIVQIEHFEQVRRVHVRSALPPEPRRSSTCRDGHTGDMLTLLLIILLVLLLVGGIGYRGRRGL